MTLRMMRFTTQAHSALELKKKKNSSKSAAAAMNAQIKNAGWRASHLRSSAPTLHLLGGLGKKLMIQASQTSIGLGLSAIKTGD